MSFGIGKVRRYDVYTLRDRKLTAVPAASVRAVRERARAFHPSLLKRSKL